MNNITEVTDQMISTLESLMAEMEKEYIISQHFDIHDVEPYRKIIETVLQSLQTEDGTCLNAVAQASTDSKQLRLSCGKCGVSQLVDNGLMQCPSCGGTENIELRPTNYVDSQPKITSVIPKEMTPEMMRAVQLNSELGAYAAANLSGAYDLFAEFWKVACRAAMLAASPQEGKHG